MSSAGGDQSNKAEQLTIQSFLSKGGRFMLIILSIVLVCLLILLSVLLAYSPGKPEPFRVEIGKQPGSSISEKIFVNIGCIKQGMFIKGKDRNNPVLLFLHGGPGMPTYFLAEKYPTGLENNFTVCYWEQRGGGISYNRDISAGSITLDQLISDAIEVTNYLSKRFGQEKIYLMGHSWGSLIGIQAAAKAPELYHAYIGVSQVSKQNESEKLAYRYMMDQYVSAGNKKMAEKLRSHPVLESDAAMITYFKSPLRDITMHDLGVGTMHNMKSVITGVFLPVMFCRAYTLLEKINLWRAKLYLRNKTKLIDELLSQDLTASAAKLEIPAYFFSGIYDYTVNYNLSKAFLESLQAPVKGFYTFSRSAHCPMHEEAEKFIGIMVEDVLNGTVGGRSLADDR